jgi:hypothetical protein
MNLQQFAKARNLKIKQVRDLCLELLPEIPEFLADEDIAILDKALLTAGQSLALPPVDEDKEIQAIAPINEGEAISKNQNDRVVQIVGSVLLKDNLKNYLENLKKSYLAQQFEIDSLIFNVEQNFYSNLGNFQRQSHSESVNRVNKNSEIFTRKGIQESITNNNNPDNGTDLLVEIGELMDFFNVA